MRGAQLYTHGEVEVEEAMRLILKENPHHFQFVVDRYITRFGATSKEARSDVFAALWNLLHTFDPERKDNFSARYRSTLWPRSLDVGHRLYSWHRETQDNGSRKWTHPIPPCPEMLAMEMRDRSVDDRLWGIEIADLYDTLPELAPMKRVILDAMRATGSTERAIEVTARLYPSVPTSAIKAETEELKEELRAKIEREYPFLVPRKERRHVSEHHHDEGEAEDLLAAALQEDQDHQDLLELCEQALGEEG